ncbi:unnamed protein product [Phytophthora fragariaefolia]|uniref:Unnamed protein product n=1 Tax=Phytophthora fragariaefolia TaxID=1490495 RepID=A0A9W6Y9F1_9STRA|nr:unnamed protein product [Phytophthora fragariaefolia]
MKNPDWRILVQPDPTDDIDFEENDSDCEEEEVFKAFDPTESLPTSLEEVEAIRNMRFVPSGEVEAPSYLFQHENGLTRTYSRPEFKHLFEHSASSSFFAYIPPIFLAPSFARDDQVRSDERCTHGGTFYSRRAYDFSWHSILHGRDG